MTVFTTLIMTVCQRTAAVCLSCPTTVTVSATTSVHVTGAVGSVAVVEALNIVYLETPSLR